VAHCPERVLPGKIIKELIQNIRVIGGITEASAQLAKHLLKGRGLRCCMW
jgi:UDP-N-acetyl-D-mannosaminuronic acid dehydrogenase